MGHAPQFHHCHTGGSGVTEPRSSQAPKVYGWCPGALRPMASGDGLVVRIRAPLGRLSQAQARGVARLSQDHGNGLIDLSARANLQLRGIGGDSYDALLSGLRALQLLDDDIQAEARRNVLLTPFWQPGDDSHTIASQLSAALTEARDLALPGKFGFAVDCGAAPVLQEVAADIRIERGPEGLLLRADGAETGHPVTRDNAVACALDLARWFVAQGGVTNGRGRMKALVDRLGPPPAHNAACLANAPRPKIGPAIGPQLPPQGDPAGPEPIGALVGLEFGQISADDFDLLAQTGPLRLTPWRMLLVEGTTQVPAASSLILDASDPRLQVVACTGAPGCLQAQAAIRDLARDLAQDLVPALPAGAHLHISGCSKGCAHPAPTDYVLTATGCDTFDLIHHGTAADQPVRVRLTAAMLRANPEILTEGS